MRITTSRIVITILSISGEVLKLRWYKLRNFPEIRQPFERKKSRQLSIELASSRHLGETSGSVLKRNRDNPPGYLLKKLNC